MTRKVPAVGLLIINEVLMPCPLATLLLSSLLSSPLKSPCLDSWLYSLCFATCCLLTRRWLSCSLALRDAGRGACGSHWPTLFHELRHINNADTLHLPEFFHEPCFYLILTTDRNSCGHEFKIFPRRRLLPLLPHLRPREHTADLELLLTCPG